MSYFKISFISLFIMAALVATSVLVLNKDKYTDIKTSSACSAKIDTSSKTCGIWEDSTSTCRKGTCDTCNGADCKSKGDPIPLIALIAAGVAFVVFLITMVLGFIHKGKSTGSSVSNFSYHSAGGEGSCGSSSYE